MVGSDDEKRRQPEPTKKKPQETISLDSTPSQRLKIKINGHPGKALIDSGAELSLVATSFIKRFGISVKQGPPQQLIFAGGEISCTTTYAELQLDIEEFHITLSLPVAPIVGQSVILGIDFLRKFGIKLDFDTDTIETKSGQALQKRNNQPRSHQYKSTDWSET